jgi:ABC-type transport system involved in multi-copper enzyme maturation permease subunit
MRTAAVLFRNEVLKATKRPATIVTLGLFAFILCMIAGSSYYQALLHPERGGFILPTAWPGLLDDPGVPSAFFAAILLILLVDSEFSWRTARQNVIDGLSKAQWFGGKLVLFALVCLGCVGLHLLVTGSVAAWGSFHIAGGIPALVRGSDLRMMGADLLMVTGLGSVAMLAAFAARSAGPAMALFFFYVALGERMLALVLSRVGGAVAGAIAFLPMRLFTSLPEPARWDPAALQKAVAAAAKHGRPPPDFSDTTLLVWVGIAEIVVLLTAAFLVYRRRDL